MQSGAIMASVTVETKLGTGKVGIAIEEVGADGAVMTIRTFNAAGQLTKTDKVELYSVKHVKNQNAIRCMAKAPGPDPDVTCTLNAGDGTAGRSIRVVVKGTLGGWGDRDETYPIADAHYQAGLSFLTAAAFPVK